MRQGEKVSWHKRVRDAAQAREQKAKQIEQAVETQATGRPGGPTSTISPEADAWVAHGAQRLAASLPRHDHIVLMAATHEGTMKTGVASVIQCDSLTAMLALGRLVGQVNDKLRRDHVNVQVELRARPIREAQETECTPRGLSE